MFSCLDIAPLYEDHTGQNIADAILDVLENWALDKDQLVAVTTDNGSNIVVALRNIAVVRVSCFGHNLDLAIRFSSGSASISSLSLFG